MSLINLPNGSKLDDEKSFNEQSEECKEYTMSLFVIAASNIINETLSDEDGELTRLKSCEHHDTDNGFKLVYSRVYVSNNVINGGACSLHLYDLKTI